MNDMVRLSNGALRCVATLSPNGERASPVRDSQVADALAQSDMVV